MSKKHLTPWETPVQSACGDCNEGCPEYQEEFCADYEKTPYTCNGCEKRSRLRRSMRIFCQSPEKGSH